MKRKNALRKGLKLNRETIRSLEDRQLTDADGGATTLCTNVCTVTQCSNCRGCTAAC
jgi:hypothetical protein